jgi:putative NIF3 family GTP cyclohydrolase 1 type 2
MTAREINHWLRSLHAVPEPSVDGVIVGDPETLVRGIAVLWMPTWAALRTAHAQGLNVVVAHEPTFFNHYDLERFEEGLGVLPPAGRRIFEATRDAKRRWIEETGVVVIRCHDVLDSMPGGVVDSLAYALGFSRASYVNEVPHHRVVRVDPPVAAIALAQRLANSFGALGQPGVAFYGDPGRAVKSLGLGTGYACEPWRFVELGADMALTIDDRIKTWTEGQWADDSGYPLVVIHHGSSEEWGVRRLAELVREAYHEIPVKLLAQGYTARWIAPQSFHAP